MNVRIFGKAKGYTGSRKRFYFTVEGQAVTRGYNRTVRVFSLRKDGSPCALGFAEVNTASYAGEYACAVAVISKVFGYRNDVYNILRKGVTIYQIG